MDKIEDNAETAVNLLKALSNENRLLIMCTLFKGEKSVSALENIIGLSQSALSQHLARLRHDGLVKTRREAQTIYYSLENTGVKAVLRCLYDIYRDETYTDTSSTDDNAFRVPGHNDDSSSAHH